MNGFIIILLVLPALAGLAVALAQPPGPIAWVNRASGWWDRRYIAVKDKGGLFAGLWRWLIWGFHKLHQWTETIGDDAKRAAFRTAFFFYVGAISLFVIASLVYIAVVITLVIIGFWILAKIFGSGDGDRDRHDYAMPRASRRGRSRKRKDWLGDDYVEHVDEDGQAAGRSKVKKDWLGDSYTERTDADGNVVETSRHRKDWLGDDLVEHRDSDGGKTGESRSRKDWLGDDYQEHKDADGVERGRSRTRRDWLGDKYTEHEPRD